MQLQLARTPPPASGATIRTPPEKAALFLTAVAPEALGGGQAAGALLKADSTGQTTQLYSGGELLGGLDLTPDGTVALVGTSTAGREGLTAMAAHTEMASTVSVPLGGAEPKDLRPPYPAVQVAVQP